MSLCLNPDCLAVNPETHRFCHKCGQKLWLKERYQALRLIGQGGFGKTFKAVTPQNRSVTGTVIGSAEYVAPEQMNGKAVNASDLYSLGVTCLHLLTGVSPFDLFDAGEHEWCWRDYLVKNPVSAQFGAVLDKMIVFGTKITL